MLNRMFLSSMFRGRNILFLTIWFIIVKILLIGNLSVAGYSFDSMGMFMYLTGLLGYVGLVVGTMYTDEFKEEFVKTEKLRNIRRLNIKCIRLYTENRRFMTQNAQRKVRKVLLDKNDIIANYEKTKDDFVRDNILEKTLNLIYSYIKLVRDYSIRNKELDSIDINTIKERISMNNRRKNFETNDNTKENLNKIIEMDQRLIERIKDEKIEIDSLKSKLEYMESTIGMLKHHTLTTFNDSEVTDQLDEVINEASALETVLDSRRKNKMRAKF